MSQAIVSDNISEHFIMGGGGHNMIRTKIHLKECTPHAKIIVLVINNN